mmetsp:Transcript_7528/g.16504  ORF Transcript_7528/g.16504 Transcript_7528/m.16504 type:complete len:242 (+) Transcript_7528:113-838(+)
MARGLSGHPQVCLASTRVVEEGQVWLGGRERREIASKIHLPSLPSALRISSSSESTAVAAGSAAFMLASSSSTEEPPSSALNLDSREPPPPPSALGLDCASSRATSASDSICSTFSFIRSKAATEEELPTPESMSFTLVAAFAVRARAMIWSFFALASAILASSSFIDWYSVSIEPAWFSTCSPSESAISVCCCLRVSASLARSSSPFSNASCAREYHLAASASASRRCSAMRFEEAETSA